MVRASGLLRAGIACQRRLDCTWLPCSRTAEPRVPCHGRRPGACKIQQSTRRLLHVHAKARAQRTHARSLARSHARTKARNALLSGSLGLGMSALTLEKVRGLSTVPTMGGAVGHTVFTESARFTFWGGGRKRAVSVAFSGAAQTVHRPRCAWQLRLLRNAVPPRALARGPFAEAYRCHKSVGRAGGAIDSR